MKWRRNSLMPIEHARLNTLTGAGGIVRQLCRRRTRPSANLIASTNGAAPWAATVHEIVSPDPQALPHNQDGYGRVRKHLLCLAAEQHPGQSASSV